MQKISLQERVSMWAEVVILNRLVPKDNPGPIFKWLFKIPILYYKLGLGWMLGARFLLLTTAGRKTGKPRYTPLEYEHDPQSGTYRVAAGWGGNTDWYKNVLAQPRVTVQVGRKKFEAVVERVADEEVARFMQEISRRHPRMDAVWSRWSDRPLDGTFESYVHAARFFPSARLKPVA